jgi:hypothetical protein
LYIALAGGVAAAIAGGLLIEKRWEDAATLAQTQQAKAAADKATAQAKAETAAVTAAKADSDSKLADATSKIDDLNTQLTAAQKAASDASTAVQTANAAAKAAQDQLDAINKTLNGEPAQQYVDEKNKAESDLAAAQAEQKILQDNLQASTQQVADLKDAINRRDRGGAMPGVSGKVTFVDRAWNFVILDVGLSAGVVPNGELIVYRGRTFLGKVRVTKVDDNDAVAEILPDVKGDIQIGDSVLN